MSTYNSYQKVYVILVFFFCLLSKTLYISYSDYQITLSLYYSSGLLPPKSVHEFSRTQTTSLKQQFSQPQPLVQGKFIMIIFTVLFHHQSETTELYEYSETTELYEYSETTGLYEYSETTGLYEYCNLPALYI